MQRELASVFRTIKDPRMSSFASVVSVNVTKDLKYAKVYVSVMGTDEEKDNTLKELELRCTALEQSYNNLKQAKILSLSDNAVNETKERISKLVREIDRCIESLKK